MFGFMLVLTFLATRDDAVQSALYDEYFANSPFQIVVSTVVGVLMWLLVAPIIAGEAAARDVATGMYPLVYTAPLQASNSAALPCTLTLTGSSTCGAYRRAGASIRPA